MKKMLQYGKHYLRAKGRHGTHSPFVYALVEQVLRNHERFHFTGAINLLSRKETNLLARTLQFLKPDFILADNALLDMMSTIVPSIKFFLPKVLVLNEENLSAVHGDNVLLVTLVKSDMEADLLQHAILSHNIKVLVIRPHADEVIESYWYALTALQPVKMRLDLWHLGLLVNDPAFKGSQYFRLR